MMKVREEIEDFSKSSDKPILNWLLDRYSWESKWNFVATCTHSSYGRLSYQRVRVWEPTKEGYLLYNLRDVEPNPPL